MFLLPSHLTIRESVYRRFVWYYDTHIVMSLPIIYKTTTHNYHTNSNRRPNRTVYDRRTKDLSCWLSVASSTVLGRSHNTTTTLLGIGQLPPVLFVLLDSHSLTVTFFSSLLHHRHNFLLVLLLPLQQRRLKTVGVSQESVCASK